METQAQHYLPKSYLKCFSNKKGDIYTLNWEVFKWGKVPRPVSSHPSKIAKKVNFYKLDFEVPNQYVKLKELDENLIENQFFKYYENCINKLIERLTIQRMLHSTDAELFIRSLFDIKMRNLYWRENFFEKNKISLVTNTLEGSAKKYVELGYKLPDDYEQVIEQIKNSFLSDERFAHKQHINSILSRRLKDERIESLVVNRLIYYEWILLYSSSGDFVTTDNPGFSVDKFERIHNTRFDDDFGFVFPLTPHYCLTISDNFRVDLRYYENHDIKAATIKTATEDQIYLYNKAALFYTNKYVISDKEESLIRFINKLKIDPFLDQVNNFRNQ